MPLGFVETGRADADTGGSVSIGSACPDAVFGSNVPLGIKSVPGSGGTRTEVASRNSAQALGHPEPAGVAPAEFPLGDHLAAAMDDSVSSIGLIAGPQSRRGFRPRPS